MKKNDKITSFSEDIEATVVKDVTVHGPQIALSHPTNKQQNQQQAQVVKKSNLIYLSNFPLLCFAKRSC